MIDENIVINKYYATVKKRFSDYISYVKNESMKIRGSSVGVNISKIIDPVKTAVLFHDLGKCTKKNQISLSRNCTAPNHEVISAAIAYHYIDTLVKKHSHPGTNIISILYSAPITLSILLHHHSMRSLKDLRIDEILKELRIEEDKTYFTRCIEESSDLYSELIKDNLVDNIKKLSNEDLMRASIGIKSQMNLFNHRDRYIMQLSKFYIYPIAIMITFIIYITDTLSAILNRDVCVSINDPRAFLRDNISISKIIDEKTFEKSEITDLFLKYSVKRIDFEKLIHNLIGK